MIYVLYCKASSSPNRTQPWQVAHCPRSTKRIDLHSMTGRWNAVVFWKTTGKIRWHLGKRLEILWKFVCHQRVNQIIILDSLNTDTNTSVSEFLGVCPTNCIQTDILKRLIKQKQNLFEHPRATCLFPRALITSHPACASEWCCRHKVVQCMTPECHFWGSILIFGGKIRLDVPLGDTLLERWVFLYDFFWVSYITAFSRFLLVWILDSKRWRSMIGLIVIFLKEYLPVSHVVQYHSNLNLPCLLMILYD